MRLSFQQWFHEYEQPTGTWQATPNTVIGTDTPTRQASQELPPTIANTSMRSTQAATGQAATQSELPRDDYKNHYVHPDLIWKSQPETTFFYTPSHRLWTFPGRITHQQALVGKKVTEKNVDEASEDETLPSTSRAGPTYSDAFTVNSPSSWIQPPNREAFHDIFGPNANLTMLNRRDNFTNAALLGRTGSYDGKKYVTFWNSPDSLVRRLMVPCLQELLAKNVIKPEYLVSHPNLKDIPAADVIKQGVMKLERNPAAEEWARRQRELHTMPSDQKKHAMRQMGQLNTNPSPNTAYQRAMQKAGIGYHAPWRGTSENQI